jgi:hypothetical protein
MTSIPFHTVSAASCPAPPTYSKKAEGMIKYYKIPKMSSNCKPLNEKYLLNQLNIGESVVVYGGPTEVTGNNKDSQTQQYRYLGWDASGSVYRNWRFPPDSSATGSVAKNWIKKPWDTSEGRRRGIEESRVFSRDPDAGSWLSRMVDPYNKPSYSTNFVTSYNALKGASWTGDILLDYAIIQQKPTDFSPGVVQMWSQYTDGSWWYEIFTIKPKKIDPNIVVDQADLIVSDVKYPDVVFINKPVDIIMTVENKGEASSGKFDTGIFGISPEPTKPITNLAPGAKANITINTKFTTSGLKKLTAKADFNGVVDESDETNNTKAFQIMVNKENEPTSPVAIISHLEGDHRSVPEISIKPAADPKLSDKLSYSPGGEAITLYEWKYKAPNGSTIKKKPVAKDFVAIGEYLVELRVTNSKNKVSEWAELIVNVATTPVTPQPTATPAPTSPEATPTPTPKRPIKVEIAFNPIAIFTGEQSKLENKTINWVNYTWSFSSNLAPLIPDATDFEHGPITFNEPGIYSATLTATDEHGYSETKTTYLSVNDPKPTAVISGVTRWIQGRPFPTLHHLNNSYSPLANRGVTIDWGRSEMRYKKMEDTGYKSGWPAAAPMALGSYELEGKVYDSYGRVSDWAMHPLEVVPDQPPSVELTAPEEGVRNNDVMLYMDASSPDGDEITKLKIEERYDADGDGNVEEETWQVLYDGPNKLTHSVKYTSVGKRQYRVTATENFGLSAISNLDETNIINIAPVTNFDVFGTIQQPDQGENSGPPVTSYTADSILRSWTLKKPYTGGNVSKSSWKVSGNSLMTRNAVWADFNGNYNLANNLKRLPAWEGTIENIYAGYKTRITAETGYHRIYSWGEESKNWKFLIRDARTGAIEGEYTHHGSTFGDSTILDINTGDINTAYFRIHSTANSNGGGLRLYNIVTGQLLQDYPNITPIPIGSGSINQSYYIQQVVISDDKNYAYVTSLFDNGQSTFSIRKALYVTKYALHQKTALWTVLLDQRDDYATHFASQPMAIDKKGNLHVTYYYHGMFQNEKDRTALYKVINPDGAQINATAMFIGVFSGVVTSLDKTTAYATTTRFVAGNFGRSRDVGVMTYNADSNSFAHYEHQSTTIADIDYPAFLLNPPAVNKDGYVNLYNGMIVTPWGSLIKNHPLSVFNNYQTMLVPHNTQADYGSSAPSYYSSIGVYGYDADLVALNRIVAQPSGNFFTIGGGTKWRFKYTPASSGNVGSAREESYQRYLAVFAPNQKDIDLDGVKTQWEFGYNGAKDQLLGTEYVDSTKVAPDGSLFMNTKDIYQLDPFNGAKYRNMVVPLIGESTGDLPRLLDDNTVEVDSETWGGLFYDPNAIMRNQVLEFQVSVNSLTNDRVIGAAIAIQDEKNLYTVEWTQNTMTLFKVVGGVKTQLATTAMARSVGIPYAFKMEAIGGTLRVLVNNVSKLEAVDHTYTKGSAGILSLGQQQSTFSQVKRTNYGSMYPEQTYEAVLVGDPVAYEKIFTDVESDTKIAEEWSYAHNPNFFDHPEGESVHQGKTYGSTINAFDKPGVYEITHRGQDNPGLLSYRKWSEPVTKLIYVHRRPIAQPDVRFTGYVYAEGETLDYETFDTSYDPDIPRLTDKLFRTRWADETTWTNGKRTFYSRPGVELIVQEQVKDLHGAWSFWAEQVVYKDASLTPPINQTKPVMTITYPTGTTAATPTVLVKEPIITWTYYDAENDPQEQYRLSVTYTDTNEVALYIDYAGTEKSFNLMEGMINPGRVVRVQGQVYAKGAWSNTSNSRYFVLDLPPETHLITYNGVDAANPVFTNQNRPQLRVFTIDPENHPIAAIDYEVYRVSDGVRVVDTNAAVAAASYTTPALVDGLYYWRARANDGFLWGPYSSNGYFFVDTVKPADVDEQLEIEPTAVTVKFNSFSDAAPSSGHATRTFYLQQVNSNGSVTNIDLNQDGTAEYSVPISLQAKTYRVTGLVAGQTYRLTVLDYDIAGNEGHYAYIHFSTNRAPTAGFDWSPKPVYEGDTITIASSVNDEDGDPLSVAYELTSPSGVKQDFSYTLLRSGASYPKTGPVLQLTEVGNWIVKQTVSDGIADPIIVTKTIPLLPLGITAEVVHTEDWEANRVRWNQVKPKEQRSPSTFWGGERFVLQARTTDTGSSTTKATKVDVAAERIGSTTLASADQKAWSGFIGAEQAKVKLETLKDGDYIFHFKATYSNGVVKETDVTIQIKDNWTAFFEFHKAW